MSGFKSEPTKAQKYVGKYFLYDTWTQEEGILLLAGIIPDTAIIRNNTDNPVNLTENKRNLFEIIDAILIDHYHKPLGDVRRQLLEKILAHRGEWEYSDREIQRLRERYREVEEIDPAADLSGFLEYQLAEQAISNGRVKVRETELRHVSERIEEYKQTEAIYNHFLKVWESGNHTEDRYPPSKFLNWAEAKRFDLTWFDNLAGKLKKPTESNKQQQETQNKNNKA